MSFDVFLSHNSRDKKDVRRLGQALRARNLTVWLDEWELQPGHPWQDALEDIVTICRSAAVCVGANGVGPWQDTEMNALLRRFVKEKQSHTIVPVIPVLLPGAPDNVSLPLFLEGFTRVDLRDGLKQEGLDQLEWGITGNKPGSGTPPPEAPLMLRLKKSLDIADRNAAACVIGDYIEQRLRDNGCQLQFEIEGYSDAKRRLEQLNSLTAPSDEERQLKMGLRMVLRDAQIIDREPETVLADVTNIVIDRFWQQEIENEFALADLLSHCYRRLDRRMPHAGSKYELFQRRDDGTIRWRIAIYLTDAEEQTLLDRHHVSSKQAFVQDWGLDLYSFGQELWFREIIPSMVRYYFELVYIEAFTTPDDPVAYFNQGSWKAAYG